MVADKESEQLHKDLKAAMEWAAKEYDLLRKLNEELRALEQAEKNTEHRKLRKTAKILHYLSKAERRAYAFEERVGRELHGLLEELEDELFSLPAITGLRTWVQHLDIEHNQLAIIASWCDGILEQEMDKIKVTAQLEERISKAYPEKAKKVHVAFVTLINQLLVQIKEAEQWIASLEATLQQAKKLIDSGELDSYIHNALKEKVTFTAKEEELMVRTLQEGAWAVYDYYRAFSWRYVENRFETLSSAGWFGTVPLTNQILPSLEYHKVPEIAIMRTTPPRTSPRYENRTSGWGPFKKIVQVKVGENTFARTMSDFKQGGAKSGKVIEIVYSTLRFNDLPIFNYSGEHYRTGNRIIFDVILPEKVALELWTAAKKNPLVLRELMKRVEIEKFSITTERWKKFGPPYSLWKKNMGGIRRMYFWDFDTASKRTIKELEKDHEGHITAFQKNCIVEF